jgi:hypothetical protein
MKALIPLLTVALVGCSESRSRAAGTTTVAQPPAIRVSGGPGEIPAGTTLEVRVNDSINSRTATEGQTFSAEIATEVVGRNGETLIPKGSAAELVLLERRDKAGIRGATMQLGFQSVTVNGTKYLVVSEEVEQTSGIGRNRRTAEMVGGGAALGTVIGAVAGGGKGAVIGGLIGAAAGAAAQILTQGEEVQIPAETVLQFRLDETLRLQAAQPAASNPPVGEKK